MHRRRTQEARRADSARRRHPLHAECRDGRSEPRGEGRINPGNYADKKKFEVREYDDAQYGIELERVADRFRPLVRRCKQNGVAMRIGTNHGSLSDRVMNRHGDSPVGMVESALEFLDVCEAEGYHDVVFSMKASNSHVAIQAYRLLAPGPLRQARGRPEA